MEDLSTSSFLVMLLLTMLSYGSKGKPRGPWRLVTSAALVDEVWEDPVCEDMD